MLVAFLIGVSTLYGPSLLQGPNDPLAMPSIGVTRLAPRSGVGVSAEVRKPVTALREVTIAPHAFINRGLFYFYQNIVGPTKGSSSCPMSPSCSEYGRVAFQRNGWPRGLLMTFDRVHRCGHDLHLYNTLVTKRGVFSDDAPP